MEFPLFATVVIDNGSETIKAGLSGEDTPSTIIPTAGLSKPDTYNTSIPNTTFDASRSPLHEQKEHVAENKSNQLQDSSSDVATTSQTEPTSIPPKDSLSHKPVISRGIIADWKLLTGVWANLMQDVPPSNFGGVSSPVLLSDAMFSRCSSRERMAEFMFEELRVPGMAVANTSVLSLFSTGRTCGLVVEAGAGKSTCVPIFEGFPLAHAARTLEVSGADLTNLLAKMIMNDPRNAGTTLPIETAKHIKESLCYFRPNTHGTTLDSRKLSSVYTERGEAGEKLYELPDGTTVTIRDSGLSLVTEALFKPSLVVAQGGAALNSLEFQGLGTMAVNCIERCDLDLRQQLLGSVVVAGGTSVCEGFAQRVHNEVCEGLGIQGNSEGERVKVVADSQRKYAAWIGGSMLTSLSTFPDMMVTASEWHESGARALNKLCM